jgi:SAM-dependent methyltransferase
MDFSDPLQRRVFFELHHGLPREGPGNRASTLRALGLTPFAGAARPLRVVDAGCGPGGQTIDLAQALPAARILALDLHEPFLDDLRQRAIVAGVADRIDARPIDMRAIDVPAGSVDLLWCEGAIYFLGVEAALRTWRPLLAPGGCIAFSESVWLQPDPPPMARRNWAEYPEMTDVAGVRAHVAAAGYDLLGDFVQPPEAWWDDYYGPLQARVNAVAPRHADDPVARAVVEEAAFEIEAWRRCGDSFGNAFFVARARS